MDEEKELFVQNWHRFEGDSILSEVGHWAWGCCYAVDTRGNYALIGNGPTLHMLDITNPKQPTIVGEYLTDGYVYEIKIKDTLAFIAIGNGLLILDISNPKSPQRISKIWHNGFDTQKVVVVDSFAYVSGHFGGVIVVDISNIYSPRYRGWLMMYGEYAQCFTAIGNLILYGNVETSEIQVANATNPDSLKWSHFHINGYATCGFAKDSILFVGTMSYSGQSFLKIFKVIAPDSALLLSQVKLDFDINGININRTKLYVVTVYGTIYAVDINDLTKPFICARYSPKPYEVHSYMSRGIAFLGEQLCIAVTSGLLILNTDKEEILKRICFFPTGGWSRKIMVKENLAFVASWFSGLWIIDVSNPQKPVPISNINVGSYTSDVVVDYERNLLFFVNHAYSWPDDTSRGLWVVDIADIYSPKVLSHYIGIVRRPPGYWHHNTISKMGKYIVVAQVGSSKFDSTLEVVDVSNPLEPHRVNVIRSYSRPYGVVIKDSILYVADVDLGLRIIDLHNPLDPVQLSLFQGNIYNVLPKDTIAYIFSPYLTSVNIVKPNYPAVICTTSIIPSGYTSVDMSISDSFLHYAGGFKSGIVDITNPDSLVLRTSNQWRDPVWAVTASNNLVYYGSKYLGMWIFKNNLVTDVEEKVVLHSNLKFDLYQNYPNPFNGITTIPISLDRKSSLTLTTYDILGREVETIFKGELKAGKYTFQWSIDSKRKPLESGTYFIVLQAERDRSVRRALYLK